MNYERKQNHVIENKKKDIIKENPLAVSRTNTGVNNG